MFFIREISSQIHSVHSYTRQPGLETRLICRLGHTTTIIVASERTTWFIRSVAVHVSKRSIRCVCLDSILRRPASGSATSVSVGAGVLVHAVQVFFPHPRNWEVVSLPEEE